MKIENNKKIQEPTKTLSTKTKESLRNTINSEGYVKGLESFKAILWALLIGLILIIITGQSNLIVEFIDAIFTSNFGSSRNMAAFLARISYLIPLGLSLAVSFKMGLFNIGASGQAFGGGTCAYIVASTLNIGNFGFIFTILIGVLVGMLIALLIGFLKTKFNISEVISSIMINWIVFYFVRFVSLDEGVMNVQNDLQMDWINDLFGTTSSRINLGFFLMLPLVPVLWFMYNKTKWGFKQDMIGNNKNVGKYLGIKENREILKTMALSGALAGLAGTIYITGYYMFLPDDGIKDIPGWTFDGITVALLGFNSPIGVIFSASFLALFQSYSDTLDMLIGDYGIVAIMIATTIVFISKSNYRILYGKRKGWFNSLFKRKKEVNNG